MRMLMRHMIWLMGGFLLLLTSCASGDKVEEEPAVLKIYVYTPDKPIVTRNIGETDATEDEAKINDLHIWVFNNYDGKLIGYLEDTGDVLDDGLPLTMNVKSDFIETTHEVDVYVLANDDRFSATATRSQLDAALVDGFGVSSLKSNVPDGGLPMSGVIKKQEIWGQAPVFSIGNNNTLATVKLVRSVSKVRFVFTSVDEGHHVDRITFDAATMPTEEYLFLKNNYNVNGGSGTKYNVGSTYNSQEIEMYVQPTPETPTTIPVCSVAPSFYSYDDQTGDNYEQLINGGLTNIPDGKNHPDLTLVAGYYLTESNIKITGKITYDGDHTKNFEMSDLGDFARNHTWIIYAYFVAAGELEVSTVSVKPWIMDWEDKTGSHSVYNW